MKKFILFVIIINLFAADVKKNSSHKIIVGYKKSFIDKINYFIPEFLKISRETSFAHIKMCYDSLTQKTPSASIGINIKLPELYIKKIKQKSKQENKKIIQSSSVTFKIRPFIRLKSNKIFFLQNIIEYEKKYLNNEYGIANKINFYPFDNYFEESINFAYFKHLKHTYGIKLNISTDKYDFPTKYYSLNFSISNLKQKNITSYGYTTGGETKKNPLIYYHKIYIDLRKSLFNKRYIFLDITPYILISKDYNYKIKPAVSSSVNIKF